MPEIRWLHLSDIHFSFKNYDTKVMRDALMKYIKELGIRFDFIAVSGDIAYKNGGYDNGIINFLNDIRKSFLSEPKNLFIVPGNHDLGRTTQRSLIINGILAEDDPSTFVNDHLDKDDETYRSLLSAFQGNSVKKGFFEFYKEITGNDYPQHKLHFIEKREFLNILHLNTCLISGRNGEEGDLVIDQKKIYKSLKEIENEKSEKLNVAIGHHSLECLSEKEQALFRNNLADFEVDIYLCGHIHKANAFFDSTNVHGIQIIGCGSGISEGYSEVGVITGEVDLSAGIAKATFHKWSKNQKWDIDSESIRRAQNGILKFDLGKKVKGKPGLPDSLDNLEDGKEYKMVFLKVDIADHSNLPEDSQQNKGLLIENFHSYVKGIVKKNKGELFNWAGDGGLFVFLREESANRVVMAGINIVQDILFFNFDKSKNPLKQDIKIRIASHLGLVRYKTEREIISADCINYVSHLEKYGTVPGAFSVSDVVFEELHESLKNQLKYNKQFDTNFIYTFKISDIKPKPSEFDMEDFLTRLKKIKAEVLSINKIQSSDEEITNLKAVRKASENFYNEINLFLKVFSDYDKNWSKEYIKGLIINIEVILTEDLSLHKEVEKFCIELDSKNNRKAPIMPLSKMIESLRINPIPELKILKEKLKKQIIGELRIQKPSTKDFKEIITRLLNANEFEKKITFIEIFENERINLLDYIMNSHHDKDYQSLMSKLWELADFVLVEDLHFRINQNYSQSRLVFQELTKAPKIGKYFKSVSQCLRDNKFKFEKDFIIRYFEKFGINPNEDDIISAKKCFLIFHPNQDLRLYVLRTVEFGKLWELIAYAKTPVKVIRLICEHLLDLKQKEVPEEIKVEVRTNMMILFDLAYKRLKSDIKKAETRYIMEQIRDILTSCYCFDFFASEVYFRRLEDIRRSFIDRAKSFKEVRTDIVKSLFEELTKKKINAEANGYLFPDVSRKILFGLPLELQRRLAIGKLEGSLKVDNEGHQHYLNHFIFHPKPIIAEVIIKHHMSLINLDFVIKSVAANPLIFSKILETPQFLENRKDLILLALTHPRCTVKFAHENYKQFPRLQCLKIANNPNSNSGVREFLRQKFNLMKR